MNFVLTEMTLLRYFIPLVIEGNRRGLKSEFYILEKSTGKYNCVSFYPKIVKEVCEKYNIGLNSISTLNKSEDLTFYIEDSGIGHHHIDNPAKKICLTYQHDFARKLETGRTAYEERLIKYYDNIILPSEYFAKFYGTLSNKNLYLGSPKYDTEIDKSLVIEKYNINESKNALVVLPKTRDFMKANIPQIISDIESMGYYPIMKTRGKDSIRNFYNMKNYFEDTEWFPHTTMELIEASDIVINFGSTTVKECVMLEKPVLNFPIKPHEKQYLMPFLYEYDYSRELDPNYKTKEFNDTFMYLVEKNHKEDFKKAKDSHLFDFKSSPKILDEVLK